jgi:hypothetical protein
MLITGRVLTCSTLESVPDSSQEISEPFGSVVDELIQIGLGEIISSFGGSHKMM